MPPAASLRALGRGTALAALAASASWAIAALGFRSEYYLSALLPLCMAAFALVAWLSYLRDDGFFRRRFRPGRDAPDAPAPGSADPGGAPDHASLFAPREDVIVPRAPEGPASRARRPAGDGDGRTLRAALVVAACELGLLAAALYSFAGIGAAFFR